MMAWLAIAAIGHPDASAWPSILLLAAVGAAFAIGQALGARLPVVLPGVVAGAVLVSILASPDALRGSPLSGPLGYANANAGLAVQGVAAGCLAVVPLHGRRRVPMIGLVAALAVVTLLARSAAADIVMLPVLGCAAWGLWRPPVPTRFVALGAGSAVVGCVLVTVMLGTAYHPGPQSSAAKVAEQTLTARRVALWHDALHLVANHPLRGVGPRRFPVESPVARRDPDTRQAHSAYLQAAAEGGVPGLALLLALICTVLARLGLERESSQAAVGAAAVGALAVHASIDYVLQFAALALTAALVAGIATVATRSRGGDHSGEVSPGLAGAAAPPTSDGNPGFTPPTP